MKEVLKDIYQIELPLVGNPLKALNSYIIVGEEECLVIDTGFNVPECRKVLLDSLDELGMSLDKVKLFITHLHSDHSGLAAELNQSGVEILTGKFDGEMINLMTLDSYWKGFHAKAEMMDLLKDGVDFGHHPGYKYCPKTEISFTGLEEGNEVIIGQYRFQVIDIPGHTPGHIGLYEQNHKLLISGDHILDPITPNIAFWGFEWNILQVYFDSLKKVYDMDVDLVLSAHRKVIHDHRKRINELIQHHEERLLEIEAIIQNDWTSVRDTAAQMKWALTIKDWNGFPDPQKWFASAEAMSHLEYLYSKGRADRCYVNGIYQYKRV